MKHRQHKVNGSPKNYTKDELSIHVTSPSVGAQRLYLHGNPCKYRQHLCLDRQGRGSTSSPGLIPAGQRGSLNLEPASVCATPPTTRWPHGRCSDLLGPPAPWSRHSVPPPHRHRELPAPNRWHKPRLDSVDSRTPRPRERQILAQRHQKTLKPRQTPIAKGVGTRAHVSHGRCTSLLPLLQQQQEQHSPGDTRVHTVPTKGDEGVS